MVRRLPAFGSSVTPAVVIVPYREEWPELFDEERRRLEEPLRGLNARVEHIGSTAVPLLAAKPVLDVAVGVSTLGEVEERIPAIEAAGYHYVPEYEAQIPQRRYFRRPLQRPRLVHVHVLEVHGDLWGHHLRFRDWLRDHPEDRDRYAALKLDLAARHGDDRVAYTDAKRHFIEDILQRSDS